MGLFLMMPTLSRCSCPVYPRSNMSKELRALPWNAISQEPYSRPHQGTVQKLLSRCPYPFLFPCHHPHCSAFDTGAGSYHFGYRHRTNSTTLKSVVITVNLILSGLGYLYRFIKGVEDDILIVETNT